MQKILSPNMLKTFETCPKKYYFRYVKNISMPIDDEIFETGKNIHALASYYLRKQNIDRMELALSVKEKELLFTDIEELFEKHNYNYKGEKGIYSGENESLIIWTGWNSETIAMLSNIMSKVPQIYCRQATQLEILFIGKALNLPIAKKIKHKYKEVHWLPSVLIWKE
jgi:hypothetical protein